MTPPDATTAGRPQTSSASASASDSSPRERRPPSDGSAHPAVSLGSLLAEAGGRISFRDFMERALYDADFGYYTTRIRDVGRIGDFSTGPTLGSVLGEAIAHWIGSRLPAFPVPCPVIEVGAGNGALAETILRSLGWRMRRRIQYHIVDRSPALRTLQGRRLAEAGLRRHAHWHADMQSALAAADGRAIVLSNELVDAFPVHLYQWDKAEGRWGEIHLQRTADGAIVETLETPSRLPEFGAPPQPGWPQIDGQRIEVPFAYRDWLASWVPDARQIDLLTIDYGDTFPQLYHRRPTGTLRAYRHQQRRTDTDLYLDIGRQDLTADVNFSLLAQWGEQLGLRGDPATTLRDFLLTHLPRLARTSSTGGDARTPTDGTSAASISPAPTTKTHAPDHAALLDPLGAGTAFKVLEQHLD